MCAQGFGTLCFGERAAFWQARKSRAEREDPDGVAAICEEAAPVLDDWEPEDIDLRPPTLEGVPDILIDDRLVMEVNRKLNKAERDRQVGQCAGYSREWVNLGCIDRHACSPRAGIGRASRRQGTGAHLGVFVF
jgi:hypothetical protein